VVSLAVVLFAALAAARVLDDDDEKKPEKSAKPFAVIFGTAYGPDDRPLYGVKIKIHPVEKKHPSWDLASDHRGEFAAHVPPGPGDYVIQGEGEYAPQENGKPQMSKKKKFKGETKVHIDNTERRDISLHLTG
jgi:hypothetical protein